MIVPDGGCSFELSFAKKVDIIVLSYEVTVCDLRRKEKYGTFMPMQLAV